MGGYKKLDLSEKVSRNFTNLPPHYSGRIRLLFMKIDSWDDGDVFYLKLYSNLLLELKFKYNDDVQMTGILCGSLPPKPIDFF